MNDLRIFTSHVLTLFLCDEYISIELTTGKHYTLTGNQEQMNRLADKLTDDNYHCAIVKIEGKIYLGDTIVISESW